MNAAAASTGSPAGRGVRAQAAVTAREAAGISYLLRRSTRARRVRLLVTNEGEAVVTLPMRAPARLADDLVAARTAWIGRHLSRIATERARLAARGPLGDGRLVDYAGEPHRLEVVALPPAARRSRIEHDDAAGTVLRAWIAAADLRPLADVLEAWLRREARDAVERRVAARAPQLRVSPAAVSIRDQRTRWGSASRHGRLSFSWRLILAPPAVLDYVVVHELAHLADFSHSARFWERVRAVAPETDRARRWLRQHARELHWSLD